jgi:hypothetical protein
MTLSDRDRHLPLTRSKTLLELRQQLLSAAEIRELPLFCECSEQPLKVAAGPIETGLVHLDEVEVDEGVDAEIAALVGLAHDLSVQLTGRGDVDQYVAQQPGMTRETLTGRETVTKREALFRLGDRTEVLRLRSDSELRKFAFGEQNLATTADAAPAADRVQIHTELTSRLEQGGPDREAPPLARRSEDDKGVGRSLFHHEPALSLGLNGGDGERLLERFEAREVGLEGELEALCTFSCPGLERG